MAYVSLNPKFNSVIFTESVIASAKNPAAGSRKLLIDSSGDVFVKDSAGSSVQIGGIGSINGLTTSTQTFATGTAGTNFGISSAGSVHTFNIPDASGANRGLVTTGAQTFGGVKTLASPIFTAPVLGTPASGNLSNCSNLPTIAIVAGTSGTLTVARGGTGVTASTGTVNLVRSNNPVLVAPALGTPASGNLSNCTNLPTIAIVAGTSGTLSVARGGTGVTTSTGTGNNVLSLSPNFTGTAEFVLVSASFTTSPGVYFNGNSSAWTGINMHTDTLRNNNVHLFTHIRCSYDNGATTAMHVIGNGNIENINNSYGSTSDVSLKENIVDATPKLDDLDRVRIRRFNRIGHDLTQIGVIAQELESVFPGMVDEDKDGIKAVKYSVFVPMLVKAVQELYAKIKKMEAN